METIDIASVLEWSNYRGEGPVALMTYGGPTVCVTVDPLTPTGVVIHWTHGNDSEIRRIHDAKFRYLLSLLPVSDDSWTDGHPSQNAEQDAHLADGTLADLLAGADAGGKQ